MSFCPSCLAPVRPCRCADSVQATGRSVRVCQHLLRPKQQPMSLQSPRGSSPPPPLTRPQVMITSTAAALKPAASCLKMSLPAAPQEYRCPPHGYHLTCSCCLEPMPERLTEQVPDQKCECLLTDPPPASRVDFPSSDRKLDVERRIQDGVSSSVSVSINFVQTVYFNDSHTHNSVFTLT